MTLKTDIIDWIGGFPYEYASTDDVIKFAHKKGFVLEKQSPCSGWTGCNEFVFRKRSIHK
jgi:2-polyprenyl-6-hydroxyphenyl methylase/3-demethylubiquinone-9 3-methyltransferase